MLPGKTFRCGRSDRLSARDLCSQSVDSIAPARHGVCVNPCLAVDVDSKQDLSPAEGGTTWPRTRKATKLSRDSRVSRGEVRAIRPTNKAVGVIGASGISWTTKGGSVISATATTRLIREIGVFSKRAIPTRILVVPSG